LRRRGRVILSIAKKLSASPVVALRGTTLVYQSFVVRFSKAAIPSTMGKKQKTIVKQPAEMHPVQANREPQEQT